MILKATIKKDGLPARDIEVNNLYTHFPVDTSIGNDSLEEILILTVKLLRPQITVGSTGISSKTLLHWKESELIPMMSHDDEGWTRLNFIQYTWLQMIKELRAFGVGFEVIRKIKDELIFPSVLYKQMQEQFSVEVLKKEYANEQDDKLKSMSSFLAFHQTSTEFSNLICESIIDRKNIKLVLLSNGQTYWHDDNEQFLFRSTDTRYEIKHQIPMEDIRLQNYISISLTGIIRDYILFSKHSLTPDVLPVLSENEMQVIKYLQEDNLVELIVMVNEKKIELIKYKQQYNSVDLKSRFTDQILSNGYQSIEMKTKDGKCISFARTTNIKLK